MLQTPSLQTKDQYIYATFQNAIRSRQLPPDEKLVIDRSK